MYQISKLSVLRAFTQTIRHSASKGGSSKDGKGDSKCAPSSKGGSSGPSKDGKGDSKSSPVIKGGSPASSKAGKSGSKCAPPNKVAASASAKDGKGESKCAPIEKLDLCESKKGEKGVKDAKASRCGGVPTTDKKPEILGGAVRESSCKPKKKPPTKGTSTAGTFRKICLFAVLPAVVLLNILILTTRTHPERPEFKKWPHLYKRDKPFFWGDGTKSFFHNPHTNALPDSGYEDE